jgi:hypothetical protein
MLMKSFQEVNCYVVCAKKIKKNDAKIRLFTRHCLSFLHGPQKLSFYYGTISDGVKCEDRQAKKNLNIFLFFWKFG